MAKEEVRELDDDTARYLKAIGAVKDAPADRTNQDSAGKSK
jgi:hypothetical protein